MDATPIVLRYPLRGRLRAENSPARRVPSHGTHVMGTTYAIDLVPVDAAGRSAPMSWRSALGTEPPDRFAGFGAPVLAPATGTVVITHDGELDHEARRSPLSLLAYALGQPRRARGGPGAIAGNHVVIALAEQGLYVLIAHLQHGSLRVAPGDHVVVGQPIGACGNSGNSTEPHVHLQVTDRTDWSRARGLPLTFDTEPSLPAERQVFQVE